MKKSIEIVMLGDSITSRGDWKKLLENEYILNLGIDGDTTKGVFQRVNRAIEVEPKIVFLMVGINDLCISIPLEEVFGNYKKICEKICEKKIKIVVQATLLTQMPAVNKKVRKFNEMLEDYCNKEKIEFLNLNEPFSNEEKLLREDLTTDGLHLGQKAYKVWAYKIKNMALV